LQSKENNAITNSDFSDQTLNYNSIYAKISNLIKSGEINPNDRLAKLIFEPPNLRKNFYKIINSLGLTPNKKRFDLKIGTLKNRIEPYIDVIYTNENSIKKDDFSGEILNYGTIYVKISNLIESGEIKPTDKLCKLIFEPPNLRTNFYKRMDNLGLTNNRKASQSSIEVLQYTLEGQLGGKSL